MRARHQILVKEEGVFTSVTSPASPSKLGLGYEVAPIALLMERAGGYSSGGGVPDSALAIVRPLPPCTQRTCTSLSPAAGMASGSALGDVGVLKLAA